MLHWFFPLNMECHQSQLQCTQKRKTGQLLFPLQPCSFVPTKNTISDTTRAVYLNCHEPLTWTHLSWKAICPSGNKATTEKGFCLSALARLLLLDVCTHSRISTTVTSFLHIMDPGSQHSRSLCPSFIIFLFPSCNHLFLIDSSVFVEPKDFWIFWAKFLVYFQSGSYCLRFYAHNIFAWAMLNRTPWSMDLIFVTVMAFTSKELEFPQRSPLNLNYLGRGGEEMRKNKKKLHNQKNPSLVV